MRLGFGLFSRNWSGRFSRNSFKFSSFHSTVFLEPGVEFEAEGVALSRDSVSSTVGGRILRAREAF